MRITTLLRRLVAVTQLIVESASFTPRGLVLGVRPTWVKPRCGRCGRRAPGYDQGRIRSWRHLAFGEWAVILTARVRRVNCPRCGVRTEKVPWAVTGSRFTTEFEEWAAYLAQATDKSKVARMLGISWSTVTAIVARVVERKVDPARLDGLRNIGIDEFGYRRRHRFLTIVVDHDRRRVVWVGEKRGAKTLNRFLTELGPQRVSQLEQISIDMSGGYLKALRDHGLDDRVVFDRFHVQRLASRAVDQVRREQLRELRGTPVGRSLFRSRFALWKNLENHSPSDRRKLSEIERNNKPLYRAYLLKEGLAAALDYKQPARAERALQEWLSWASRSRLRPFVKVGRTIRRHFDGILAYIRNRLTNALSEGINNRIRMAARRAFGFHGAQALIGMIFLCCGGISLNPRFPGTHSN